MTFTCNQIIRSFLTILTIFHHLFIKFGHFSWYRKCVNPSGTDGQDGQDGQVDLLQSNPEYKVIKWPIDVHKPSQLQPVLRDRKLYLIKINEQHETQSDVLLKILLGTVSVQLK